MNYASKHRIQSIGVFHLLLLALFLTGCDALQPGSGNGRQRSGASGGIDGNVLSGDADEFFAPNPHVVPGDGSDVPRARVRPPAPQRGPGIAGPVDNAWNAMAKDHDEKKIAVIKLTEIEELDVSEKFLEIIESFRPEDKELKHSVVTTGGTAAAVLAPVEDLQQMVQRIEFGRVAGVDTARRVVEVAPYANLFPKNAKGAAADRSHPNFFRANAVLLNNPSGRHSYVDQELHKVLARLKFEDPQRCADPEVRRSIVRAYREYATGDSLRSDPRRDAIQGFANWAGADSVPVLIDMLESTRGFGGRLSDFAPTLIESLGELQDARAIEPLGRMMADTGFHSRFNDKQKIATALSQIGPAAEDMLMDLAPHNDPEVSQLSIQVLGDVGTEKSIPLLRQASKSRNADVRFEAERAMDKINRRQQDAEL